MIPITYIYSCWVYIWTILFICNFTNINPLVSLIFSFICGSYLLITNYNSISHTKIILITSFKLLLITISSYKKTDYDFISFILSFLVYNLYLYINNKTIYEIYYKDLPNDQILNNSDINEIIKKRIKYLLNLYN